MAARDPHRFVNELDPSTLDRLINRLESRGKDAVFNRLLEQYLGRLELDPEARVLEIGCGTGVVTRSIARLEGFHGEVTGLDQSPVFIEAARERAAGEGLDQIGYQVGDAHRLPFGDGTFDAVIAHTVLSHVTDPTRVLAEMGRVLRPGGAAVVFDGDYASLTYAHDDPSLGRRMDAALSTATFNNPTVMRGLPRTLPDVGLGLSATLADVVAEVGDASYFRSFADTYAPMVSQSGLVPDADVSGWLEDQYRAMDERRFFASCNYYTMIAQRPA